MSSFEEIDAEILVTIHRIVVPAEELRALRTRRNSLTLLCALPIEILGRVLEEYQSLHFESVQLQNDGYERARGVRSISDYAPTRWPVPAGQSRKWIRVSGVCAYMRQAVTENPALWAHVDLRHRYWSEVAATRCLGPVSAFTWQSQDVDKTILASLLSRVQQLCLPVNVQNRAYVLSIVSSRLPLLRTLRLHLKDGFLPLLEEVVPSTLWTQVKMLDIGPDVVISRNSALRCPLLTYLYLHFQLGSSNVDSVISLLASSPNLRSVYLREKKKQVRDNSVPSVLPPPSIASVSLPHLTSFTVAASLNTADAILQACPDALHLRDLCYEDLDPYNATDPRSQALVARYQDVTALEDPRRLIWYLRHPTGIPYSPPRAELRRLPSSAQASVAHDHIIDADLNGSPALFVIQCSQLFHQFKFYEVFKRLPTTEIRVSTSEVAEVFLCSSEKHVDYLSRLEILRISEVRLNIRSSWWQNRIVYTLRNLAKGGKKLKLVEFRGVTEHHMDFATVEGRKVEDEGLAEKVRMVTETK
jgi:hypothetical protein